MKTNRGLAQVSNHRDREIFQVWVRRKMIVHNTAVKRKMDTGE